MGRSFSSGETIERFLRHVEKRPARWWWHGSKHPRRGYGLFRYEGRAQVAHHGWTQVELAYEFGISRPTVSQIVRRVTWQHV